MSTTREAGPIRAHQTSQGERSHEENVGLLAKHGLADISRTAIETMVGVHRRLAAEPLARSFSITAKDWLDTCRHYQVLRRNGLDEGPAVWQALEKTYARADRFGNGRLGVQFFEEVVRTHWDKSITREATPEPVTDFRLSSEGVPPTTRLEFSPLFAPGHLPLAVEIGGRSLTVEPLSPWRSQVRQSSEPRRATVEFPAWIATDKAEDVHK